MALRLRQAGSTRFGLVWPGARYEGLVTVFLEHLAAFGAQDESRSRVARRIAVAPFPAGDGGQPAAALGGAQLAINARSAHPALAFELVAFLTAPEQMIERGRLAAQLPPRRSLYETPELAAALPIPLDQVRQALEAAVPRPATPVYSELSELLQVRIHRALTGQQAPAAALEEAAREMRALLTRAGLSSEGPTR